VVVFIVFKHVTSYVLKALAPSSDHANTTLTSRKLFVRNLIKAQNILGSFPCKHAARKPKVLSLAGSTVMLEQVALGAESL